MYNVVRGRWAKVQAASANERTRSPIRGVSRVGPGGLILEGIGDSRRSWCGPAIHPEGESIKIEKMRIA